MRNVNFIKSIVAEKDVCLRDRNVRKFHFLDTMHDSADTFEIGLGFLPGRVPACSNCYVPVIFFSSELPEKEIRKYEKMIRAYAGSKYLSNKANDKRWNTMAERFGKAGEEILFNLFKWSHEL